MSSKDGTFGGAQKIGASTKENLEQDIWELGSQQTNTVPDSYTDTIWGFAINHMNGFTLKKQLVISSPKTRTITYDRAVHGPHVAYGGPAQDIFENLFRDFSAFQVVVCGNGYRHALGQFVCNVLGNSISKQKYGLSFFFPL